MKSFFYGILPAPYKSSKQRQTGIFVLKMAAAAFSEVLDNLTFDAAHL
jgi:hypothetical protein